MTISASTIVNVNASIAPDSIARANFGITMFITNETDGPLNSADRIRQYESLDEVATDWDTTSEVYEAANIYYQQSPRPRYLKVGLRLPSATEARFNGDSTYESSIATWNAITDGAFKITLDGVVTDVTGMDFSADTNLGDVISTVNSALSTAGVTVIGQFDNAADLFYFFANETFGQFLGEPDAGTSITTQLGMSQNNNTRSNPVIAAETITDSLTALNDQDPNWWGFLFSKEMRDGVDVNGSDGTDDASLWAQTQIKLFGNITNNLSYATPNNIHPFTTANRRRTFTTIAADANTYPAISVFGRTATIDFSLPDSTITMKFKQLPGILPEPWTSSQYSNLRASLINSYITVGGQDMFAESYVHEEGLFIDDILNIDWLVNALQAGVFDVLYQSPTKVPLTDKGAARLEQACVTELDRSRENGMIAPGEDIEGNYLAKGYSISTLPVADILPGGTPRQGPPINIKALLAGAIHAIQINLVLER